MIIKNLTKDVLTIQDNPKVVLDPGEALEIGKPTGLMYKLKNSNSVSLIQEVPDEGIAEIERNYLK